MKVLVALDHRFDRTPDGKIFSWFFGYDFWSRYLQVFDTVNVLARVRDIPYADAISSKRSDGENVSFIAIPFFHGPIQYLGKINSVRSVIYSSANLRQSFILRGGHISNSLAGVLSNNKIPYGLEVVGDPYDVFSPAVKNNALYRFCRWWYPRQLRILCRKASAVTYVTKNALQRRYPANPSAFLSHYSSIDLKDEAIMQQPRHIKKPVQNILAVGTMDQMYKGQSTLLKAFSKSLSHFPNLFLTIVGDGKLRQNYTILAKTLKVQDKIAFLGTLTPGNEVREQMDHADLFVLPSLTEGLPRALIEAMARAMPCVATDVGGVSELLPPENIVPADDPERLAQKICEVTIDIKRLNTMSRQNLSRSNDYRSNILTERRFQFYNFLKKTTKEFFIAQK